MSAAMKKSEYMATVFNGHSHIERRIYTDNTGKRHIKINGCFFSLFDLMKVYEVDTWYDGGGKY